MSPTELYLANQKTIKGKIREYHNRVPHVPVEDLESEANETFVQCLNEYKPDRGASFTTYLNTCLKNNFENFLVYFVKDWDELQEYIFIENSRIDMMINYPDWLKSLSQKSQKIIDIIFNTDTGFISSGKNKITKKSLTAYLRGLDWKFTDILNCFNEISLALERM
ncbi:MAG: hypothetical protein M0P71_12810 [Melioribacteraceae bacterium]|jgi:hypothetical protein|nr:hypothetical protein [Melioribacteraceae bacterium]